MSGKFLQKIFGRRTDTPIPAPTTPDPETGQQDVTAAAEAQAEIQGSHNDPEQTTQPCTGWIELDSSYFNNDRLAVRSEIRVYRVTEGAETDVLVDTVQMTYTNAGNDRPQNADAPQVAMTNGNPRIILGGENGYPAAHDYYVSVRPLLNEDNNKKYVIDDTAITQSDIDNHANLDNTFLNHHRIINPDTGLPPLMSLVGENDTINQHSEVTEERVANTDHNGSWNSRRFLMHCASRDQPVRIRMQWLHYCSPRAFAFNHLLNLEGGFVNDPADRGRATNMGITIGTWERYARSLFGIEPTIDTLRHITEEQVYQIFSEGYWRRYRADEIHNYPMAIQYVDTAYNGGGVIVLQRSVNALTIEADHRLIEDGNIGPATIAATNRLIELNRVAELYRTFREQRIARFRTIVSNNSSQQRFLRGWINRANEFDTY